MNKGLVAIIVIIVVVLVAAGAWIIMQPSTTNTNNNQTANTTNTNQTTNKIQNQTHNNTNVTITAEKAKELATQYTGMGVNLGTPTLTTVNGTEVWAVPVYTSGLNKFVDNIYINAKTGARVQ